MPFFGLGFVEMLVLFLAPFPMLAGAGYIPSLFPTPAAKTEIAITRASAFAYTDKSKGGKVSVRCVGGLMPGERCTAMRAELLAGDKRVPLTSPRRLGFPLMTGSTATFGFTAHGVPPGNYRATVTVEYVAKDGSKQKVTATEVVRVP